MKKGLMVVIVILSAGIGYGDFFSIGGYHIEKLHQADSCFINSALIWGVDSWVGSAFKTADSIGMKIILGCAHKPYTPAEYTIQNFSSGQLSVYEADSSCFNHSLGDTVTDMAASGDKAWAVKSTSSGYLLNGPWTDEPYVYWRDSLNYYAYFTLKTNDTSQTNPICSLIVRNIHLSDTTIKAKRTIRGIDFINPGVYQSFRLDFKLDKYEACSLGYCIWYKGTNDSLYCDTVIVRDTIADNVIRYNYNNEIQAIARHYIDNYPNAMFRYYMFDEPSTDQYNSCKIVNDQLKIIDQTRGGIQALSNPNKFQDYLDSVDTDELMFDYYPLYGNRCPWDNRVPPDSDRLLQPHLDEMCGALGNARNLIKSHTGKKFFFIPQTFGHAVTDDNYTWQSEWNDSIPIEDEGVWREPTPREMKCMVWLALAYGAKGICHFLYDSEREEFVNVCGYSDHHWIVGMTDDSCVVKRPLWYTVKSLNEIMESIGPRLIELTSDTVFKSSAFPSNCCNITYVSDTLMQIGTFRDLERETDRYFIIVNRHCLPSESLEVMVGINNADSLFIWDCYNQTAISPVVMIGPPPPPFYFNIKLKPGEGKLLRLVPFSHDFQVNQKQTYANLPYVAIRTKASSILDVDSIVLSQVVPDSITPPDQIYSTGWIAYDTAYAWYLRQGEDTNTIRIQYKVGGFSNTPVYYDSIILDKTAPTGSFVINNNDRFTNNPGVTIQNSLSDSKSSMSKMRYGEKYLKNIVTNSSFESRDTVHWKTDTAVFIDSLKLFELPIQTSGNYFLQRIPADSLTAYYNDTMLLAIDLVSDSFIGTGKVKFQYICSPNPDTCLPMGAYPCSDSIIIPLGTKAEVSQYNLNSYFKYYWGQTFSEVRVGIFVAADATNKGKLYIDNFRVDVVGPPPNYEHFANYDTLASKTLSSGNDQKVLYGQFQDGSGNETGVLFDSIIVDTTKPKRKITSPTNGRSISNSVSIKGWAYDKSDPQQHFKQYELQYNDGFTWHGIVPDSLKTTPVDSGQPVNTLGQWNTLTVADGWYYLRLTVRDSAANARDTLIRVQVKNYGKMGGMYTGFSNYVYGVASGNDVYIGEFATGKIYRYNTENQPLDTFQLVDSSGIGFPYMMANDDSLFLWVSNHTSHKISKYNAGGDLMLRFADNFAQPAGLAFDRNKNIWIADRLHNKIKQFDRSGNMLREFGTKGTALGKIQEPLGLALFDDQLYIADSKNNRISVFDTLGGYIRTFGEDAGLKKPCGLVIDSAGFIYVSDLDSNRVVEFDPYGSPIYEIDSILDMPTGLSLSNNDRLLYVSDTRHKRVLVFTVVDDPPMEGGEQSAGDYPLKNVSFSVYPTVFSGRLNIRLQAVAGKKLTLKIYDITGRLVKNLLNNVVMVTDQTIIWDGKDEFNRLVANGVYFIQVDIDGKKKTNKALMIK